MREVSIRGRVIRDLIAHVTNDNLIGRKIKTGELRKKLVEPKWKCPDCFSLEEIRMPHFQMEYLKRKESPREDYVILQLHGGGYIGAMRNAYRSFAGLYCEASRGMGVLTVDYRVAPENPYPAALEDALEAYRWLRGQGWSGRQIFVAGDSAGGGLALALCMKLKSLDMRLPGGLVLMSPWADLTASGPSYEDNYGRDVLFGNTRDSLIYNRDYVGTHDPGDPFISPMFGEYWGFPPMLLQAGSDEMLLSDSIGVAYKAKRQGVRVRLHIYEGMFHDFQMGMLMMPESKAAWREVGRYFDTVAGRPGKPRQGRTGAARERA